jgi:hypothetical protein
MLCQNNFEEPPLRQSRESCAAHRVCFSIGGVSVRLQGEDAADIALDRSLNLFRAEEVDPDISMSVEWVESLPRNLRRPIFDSGSVWRLYQWESGFQFDFGAPIFGDRPCKRLFVGSNFHCATLKMSTNAFAGFPFSAQPFAYPLDELLIMHRLTQERAVELHAVGIVGPDGASNLFVGHSGAGKSTTARLWTTRHEVEILSDDRIIVRPDTHPDGYPGFSQMRMYGTPWHGEAMFASPNSAPLSRIFILEHGKGNLVTRLSRGQAVAELFARSFVPFHRHDYVDSALSFLEQVAESVPCYRYSFEPDERAVERVLNIRD